MGMTKTPKPLHPPLESMAIQKIVAAISQP
jgi:hypothetical protein